MYTCYLKLLKCHTEWKFPIFIYKTKEMNDVIMIYEVSTAKQSLILVAEKQDWKTIWSSIELCSEAPFLTQHVSFFSAKK